MTDENFLCAKGGHEFPQFFALWLERSGAVRLIAEAETWLQSHTRNRQRPNARKSGDAATGSVARLWPISAGEVGAGSSHG